MKSKISTRIFIALLAVGLIPLITIFLYISSRYSADLRKSVLKQNEVIQQTSADALDGYLKKIEFISNSCFDVSMQNILKGEPGDAWTRYNTQAQIEKDVRLNLDLFNILDTVDLVSIFTVKGAVYNIGGSPFIDKLPLIQEQLSNSLINNYKMHGLFSLDTLFPLYQNSGKLLYARSINDISINLKNIATLLIVFDAKQVEKLLSTSENALVTVTDVNGNIIYSNFDDNSPDLQAFVKSAKAVEVTKANTGIIKSEYHTETLDLTINYYDDLDVLLAPVNNLRGITLGIILISVMLILILASLVSKGLVRPIKNLQKAVMKVQNGKFDINVKISTKDELGELCNSFNLMAQRIDILINEVYATQLNEKEAIIASLTSQINPHFLYNTLDMVKSMADLQGADEISEITMALSGLFRYSTQNDKLVVTIGDELDNLKNYISILKARFGDRISFDINADSGCMNCKIIKVCLQPLLENSVSHGLSQKPGLGKISVNIKAVDNLIVITESDDGVGMSPAALQSLRECGLSKAAHSDDSHSGVGLYNISQRIKLYYGESYGLEIESALNKGTTVTIKIPMQY